jgi:diadenosine tetraphosphate (Ap4A) HIT family hydrolase
VGGNDLVDGGIVDPCPFCLEVLERDALMSNEHSVALSDPNPVAVGHTLVISADHVPNLLELSPDAVAGVWRLVSEVCASLRAAGADAFTIGANVGRAAGQTVDHAHVHVIPRTFGDVDDPRGGVRGVVPSKRRWEAQVAGPA